uniref:Uncharacterized protein n=1 Tax=Arundo donax TaxID=35708 RepID=A0A0A9D0M9_ARUDO
MTTLPLHYASPPLELIAGSTAATAMVGYGGRSPSSVATVTVGGQIYPRTVDSQRQQPDPLVGSLDPGGGSAKTLVKRGGGAGSLAPCGGATGRLHSRRGGQR